MLFYFYKLYSNLFKKYILLLKKVYILKYIYRGYLGNVANGGQSP